MSKWHTQWQFYYVRVNPLTDLKWHPEGGASKKFVKDLKSITYLEMKQIKNY